MFSRTTRKAMRISMNDMAAAAATGVARALEARQAAGVALNAEELTQISGGAATSTVLSKAIIAGGLLADMAGNWQPGGLPGGMPGGFRTF